MTLKDLIMQVAYGDIVEATAKVFADNKPKLTKARSKRLEKMFARLQDMEPEPGDMKLLVSPNDVSGYYDEVTLKEHPEYHGGLYSLVCTPWSKWLGMEVSQETLESMSVSDILGNCLYEMTYFGYEEAGETVPGLEDRGESGGNDAGGAETGADLKTKCKDFVAGFIPSILPGIARTIGTKTFERKLQKADGPFCDIVPVEEGLPLTGVCFQYIYNNGSCLLGVAAMFGIQMERPQCKWFANSLKELQAVVRTEDCKNLVIEVLKEQIDNSEACSRPSATSGWVSHAD